MVRPPVPDKRPGKAESPGNREPWEWDPELAKYKAIEDFLKRSGDLSDTSDAFKNFEAKWTALNRATGYDNSLRLGMYRHFKHTSPDRARLARGEITRLLSQPKIVVHGNDLINPEVKEPGFFASVLNGMKRAVGLQTENQKAAVQANGRQQY